MKGKLIVIDGLDASGKGTQAPLLTKWIESKNLMVKELSFPCYESPSSSLIKMYLNGDMGKNPTDVNAYSSSVFYSVDRYASYKTQWEKEYLSGTNFVANRYTTSNIIHQMGKLPKEQWTEYINWLEETEYTKMGIPKPDVVLFLDVPVEISQKLLLKRYCGDESKKDIHECDVSYLNHCRETALFAAEYCKWQIIECTKENEMLSVDEIHELIVNNVSEVFK